MLDDSEGGGVKWKLWMTNLFTADVTVPSNVNDKTYVFFSDVFETVTAFGCTCVFASLLSGWNLFRSTNIWMAVHQNGNGNEPWDFLFWKRTFGRRYTGKASPRCGFVCGLLCLSKHWLCMGRKGSSTSLRDPVFSFPSWSTDALKWINKWIKMPNTEIWITQENKNVVDFTWILVLAQFIDFKLDFTFSL